MGNGWEDEAIDEVSESLPEVALDGICEDDRYMGDFLRSAERFWTSTSIPCSSLDSHCSVPVR
jgi:hypothetical protein